jgi:MOSC domain-containing protein YiiM
VASIHSIVRQPLERVYGDEKIDYIRVPARRAALIAGHGIEGDLKAGHHPDRNLNLLSLEWLETLGARGWKTEPGQFGEQIIVAGLAIETLDPGTRLRLGPQAVIEISKPRTGCVRFEAAQGRPRKGIEPLGVMARVLEGGEIQIGDAVAPLVNT